MRAHGLWSYERARPSITLASRPCRLPAMGPKSNCPAPMRPIASSFMPHPIPLPVRAAAPTKDEGAGSRRSRTWSGSPAAPSAWAPSSTIPKSARCTGARGRLLDGPLPGHERALPAVRGGDRPRHVRRDPARSGGLSRRAAGDAYAGSLVFVKPAGPVDLRDIANWWQFMRGADWRHPQGPRSSIDGLRAAPRRPRDLRRRGGVRALGGQGAAHRGRVGVRRPRRARRRRVRLGRRVHAERRSHGEHLAGRVPLAEPGTDGYEGTSPVGAFPRQRLRASST